MLSLSSCLASLEAETRYSAKFNLSGARVFVSSNRPEQLDILSEYLEPYRAFDEKAAFLRISSVLGGDQAAGVLNFLEEHSAAYVLDHHPDTSYEVLETVAAQRIFRSRKGFPHSVICHEDQRVTVLSRSEIEPEAVKPTLRLIREFFVREAERHGAVSFHASSASINDAGYMLVGDSGAGKTTLALAIARSPGGQFLASDRTMIKPSATGLAAIAWPMVINVGAGTCWAMEPNSSLWEARLARLKNAYFNPPPVAGADSRKHYLEHKHALTPREAKEIFSISVAPRAELRVVAFPRITEEHTSAPRIRRLTTAEATNRLMNELRGVLDRTYSFGIFDCAWRSKTFVERASIEIVRLLATSIPCVELLAPKPFINNVMRGAATFPTIYRDQW